MSEIEILPVGGYNEFGRNMTVVRVGREAVIIDMGLKLDRVLIHEDAVFESLSPNDLWDLGAIPDDRVLQDLPAKVIAIVLSHGHLDHIGAVRKLAGKYDCPVIGTP
ncbi:MAG: MBL fold metallo-hydrolase, partial [bacterium]